MENGNADLTAESSVINEDEEFYENLEAPKFVDFTVPDLSQPHDESWFCLKIGCDQNHEQIDPEALDKSFMLRVMAARSPNVRLRKNLKRWDGRLHANCPHSAPAKQPRSRLVRLSTATEIPEKIANSKLRNHPISNLVSTPNQTKKKILPRIGEKEAISTPKNERNMTPEGQPASGGKHGSAFFSAKPLFSPTPKKEIKEVCAKLRKLNLNNTKKRSVPSRYLSQVSKASKRCDESKLNDSKLNQETDTGPRKNTSRPLWKTKHQLLEGNTQKSGSDAINCEEKSKLGPKKESLRATRKLSRAVLKENGEDNTTTGVENREIGKELALKPEIKENVGVNDTNMESLRATRKLSRAFLKENGEDSTTTGVENREIGKEVALKPEIKETVGVNDTNMEQKLKMGPNRKSSRRLWKSNQPVLKTNIKNGITSGAKNEEVVKKKGLKSNIKYNMGTTVEKDNLRNELENCENCDENKENIMQNGTKRVQIGKKMTTEKKQNSLLRTIENVPPQQVLKLQAKPSQVNPDQGAKTKRTTNPKPFRFRTDERVVLKEANLEKRRFVQSEPLKEENKSVLRKEGPISRRGRVVPSRIQCRNKGPTSLASKMKNGPSILCEKKQEAVENTKSTRGGGAKKMST